MLEAVSFAYGFTFHNAAYAISRCSRNIEMTPLRKVEMAL